MRSDEKERPHTHTQFHDRTGVEAECRAGDHHYVFVEEGVAICTRCGDAVEDVVDDD